jgi:chitinase
MQFRTLGIVAALLLSASIGGCAHYEIVGYYAGWKPETAIAPREMTVVNYAFAYVGADGTIVLDGGPAEEAAFARLRALKERDPDVRVMVSVGGWTRSDRFSDMAADAAKRAAFADSAIGFLRRHRFDGIDIDWEYPGDIGFPCPAGETCQRPEDKRNFVALARELRSALDAAGRADGKRYLETIAAGADEKFLLDASSAAWLRDLAASLDWINLMSYDYHGSWERVAGFNASLADVEASVKRLIANGVPARKLVLGIPFYGKGWAGCAPGPAGDGLDQPCSGLASGSADESFDFAYLTGHGYLVRDGGGRYTVAGPGFVRRWSGAAQVPYLYDASNGVFITYDDEASVREKVDLVKHYGLRGAMFWELGADRDGVLRGVVAGALHR